MTSAVCARTAVRFGRPGSIPTMTTRALGFRGSFTWQWTGFAVCPFDSTTRRPPTDNGTLKSPLFTGDPRGWRYWDRTSDLCRVKVRRASSLTWVSTRKRRLSRDSALRQTPSFRSVSRQLVSDLCQEVGRMNARDALEESRPHAHRNNTNTSHGTGRCQRSARRLRMAAAARTEADPSSDS